MGLRPEYEDAFNSYRVPGLVTNTEGVSFSLFCKERSFDFNHLPTEKVAIALCVWVTGRNPGGESGMGSRKRQKV